MLKYCILAFFLVGLAHSTSFAETADCLKGPEFWCKSISNSKRCGAFKHCLQTVWSRHTIYLSENVLTQDKSCDACTDCLRGDLRRCPNVEMYLDEITELYLANIPTKTICKLANACKPPAVSENVQEQTLEDVIKCSSIHPRYVCETLENARACHSVDRCLNTIWKQLEPMQLSAQHEKSGAVCGYCIYVFNKLHQFLQSNQTEVNIEEYLTSACTLLSKETEQTWCRGIIKDNLLEIYNLLRNNVDPGITCRVLRFCENTQLESKGKDENKISVAGGKATIEIVQSKETIISYKPLAQNEMTPILVEKLSKSNGVACEVCSLVLDAAKFMISSEKTEDQILYFLETEVCAKLGSLNSSCVQLIATEGKTILMYLANDVDPSVICKKMGLCLNIQLTSPTNLRFYNLNIKDSMNCTLCKMVITNVKNMLANKQSETQILNYVNKNLCEKTGKYVEMCKTIINAYGPTLLHLISNDIVPAQICQIIGMCQKPPKMEETAVEQVSGKQTPQCILCEFVMTTLVKYVNQNSTSAEVTKWLDYVCTDVMPVTIRTECKTFVDEYEPVIISLLGKQIDPAKMCQTLGLCDKPFELSLKSEEQPLIMRAMDIKASSQCVICEFAMSAVVKVLSNNASTAEAQKALDYVCMHAMPVNIRDQCKAFVDQYSAVIVAFIVKQVDPNRICQMIGVCEKKEKFLQQPKFEITTTPQCIMCEFVLTALKKYVTQNATGADVEKWLQNVCNSMPATIRGECKSFVSEYESIIISLVINNVDPEKICQTIKVCTTAVESIPLVNAAPIIHEAKPLADTTQCIVCEFAVKFLEYQLKNNRSEKAVEDALNKVCKLAPSKYKDQCVSIINTYGPYLVHLIFELETPEKVCEVLGLCPGRAQLQLEQPKPVSTFSFENVPQESFECTLCLYISEILDHYLKQNKTEEEIVAELEKVCGYFPAPIKDQCKAFVDQYGPYMLQLLAEDLDAHTVCIKMKLCKEKEAKTPYKDFRQYLRLFEPRKPAKPKRY